MLLRWRNFSVHYDRRSLIKIPPVRKDSTAYTRWVAESICFKIVYILHILYVYTLPIQRWKHHWLDTHRSSAVIKKDANQNSTIRSSVTQRTYPIKCFRASTLATELPTFLFLSLPCKAISYFILIVPANGVGKFVTIKFTFICFFKFNPPNKSFRWYLSTGLHADIGDSWPER